MTYTELRRVDVQTAPSASDVAVVPAGEMTQTDAQAALETLFDRTSPLVPIEDLRSAITVTDDFLARNTETDGIGELGWSGRATSGGLIFPGFDSGVVGSAVLSTGQGTRDGAYEATLETVAVSPVNPFMARYRFARWTPTEGQSAVVRLGVRGASGAGVWIEVVGTADPQSGVDAVASSGEAVTRVSTGATSPNNLLGYLEVTIVGGAASVYHWFVGDVRIATISTDVPPGRTQMHPFVEIARTEGVDVACCVAVDYLAMRAEAYRAP